MMYNCMDIMVMYKNKYSFIKTYNKNSFWAMELCNRIGIPEICLYSNKEIDLFRILHEIGHCETYSKNQTKADREFNATQWAIKEFNQLNLNLSNKDKKLWQEYIYSFTKEKDNNKYKLQWNI